MKIFGFMGEAQTGKDSSAGFIKELLPDKVVAKIAFARPLKQFIIDMFDFVDSRHCWGSNKDKDEIITTWGKVVKQPLLKKYNKCSDDLMSCRSIMQIVGSDALRHGAVNDLLDMYVDRCHNLLNGLYGSKESNPNIWIDLALKDIKESLADIVVVSDVRFKNELTELKKIGAKSIRLYRDTGISSAIAHISELEMAEIDDSVFDYVCYEHENKLLKNLRVFIVKLLNSENLLGFNQGGVLI